jgi:ubiquinone/menaquinone biosynthesis C-methylase UbiE
MFKSSKESGDYLGQIRNNIQEKTDIVGRALDTGNLPKTKNGVLRLVELGTGGGESLRRLKEKTSNLANTELIAVDIIPELLSSLKKEIGMEAVASDAGNLPFADESISAVNASAVLHEISSYGTKSKEGVAIYGKEAVRQALLELNRVLLPEGIIAYRDVLAPVGDLNESKAVEYKGESWELFAKWFLQDFVNSQPKIYKQSGLQREFQRHYLMLRDYLRTVKTREFGVDMLRSVWLNETQGLKSITFSIEDRLISKVDLSVFDSHESAGGMVYVGNSDQFDQMYDDLMSYYFSTEDEETTAFKTLIEDWKEREGSEHYLYGNIIDILEMSISNSIETNSEYVLFPNSADDVVIAPRFYYNRYLNQVSDNPEKDGKQIIALSKIHRSRVLKSLESLEHSSFNGAVLNPVKLKELRIKIESSHLSR